MSDALHPIRERFDWLHDQWVAFAENPDARVFCWRFRDDEQRMLEAFFAKENDDEAGELPDLFVRFETPFHRQSDYGFFLREALIAHAQQLASDPERAADDAAPWQPPVLHHKSENVSAFTGACEHFHAHYALPGQLAVVLAPVEVSDVAELSLWILSAARLLPPHVRLVLLDSAQTPAFQALGDAGSKLVVVEDAALDMPSALLELSRNAGELDTPAGMFRHLFVGLTGALSNQDLTLAEQLAVSALAITAVQKWHALEVPIHLAIGTALAGQDRLEESHARHLAAEESAQRGAQAGDPACAILHAQTRMARGGVLIRGAAYKSAAELYEQTLPMARELADPRMVIDCYRLASFSREQNGQLKAAWQHGLDCLIYTRSVPVDVRKTSTLSYMGESMQRMSKQPEYRGQGPRVQREVDGLLADAEAPRA